MHTIGSPKHAKPAGQAAASEQLRLHTPPSQIPDRQSVPASQNPATSNANFGSVGYPVAHFGVGIPAFSVAIIVSALIQSAQA